MCGRFTNRKRKDEIVKEMGVDLVADEVIIEPRYNVAPSQDVPVVAAKKDDPTKRSLALLKWGLYPSWSDSRTKPINARMETVPTSGMFRKPFAARRCLLPADGFIEWKPEGKKKQPYHFHLASKELFAFAGLYEANLNYGPTCCIITTTPNELVAEVHDRMPVLLHSSAYAKWLDRNTTQDELLSLLVPFPAEEMEAVAVSEYVNSARHEGPECLAQPTSLFA